MHGLVPLPGDLVWIRRRRWRVERVRRDHHVVRLDVAARDRRLTFLSPFDRALTRAGSPTPRRVRPQEALARLAHLIAHADDVRVPSAAVDASADILPHQLEPVMAVLAGESRLLIADEVGLGKTVQAGLVIAELMRREGATRVLVLVPAALREQWTDELSTRFRLPCLAADRAGLDALSRAGAFGDSPWQRAGVWIASPDFLKQRHVAESLPSAPWDLLVIDEAHTICGDSNRYELAQHIAGRSRRVILLTATPHGGDDARFTRLVNLGRLASAESAGRGEPTQSHPGPEGPGLQCTPGLQRTSPGLQCTSPGIQCASSGFHASSNNELTIFRRTRAALGGQPPRRVRWHPVALSEIESRVLDTLRAFERTVIAGHGHADQALLLLSVFRKRALSTMSALAQSLTRRLAWLGDLGPEAALEWSQPRLEFEDEDDHVGREEREGLTAHTGLGERQERSWLRRLRALAEEASREERKVERLAALIHRSDEPVVVFTEFRDSLDVIRHRLGFSRAVSVLHGGQDQAERRQQLRQFLDGSTSVLLATDVAGQGLNLQSRARWVISLELPWNPTRLEQRIGRVDRISQTRSTHLTLLIARDEAESGLLAHLSRRILAAQHAFSGDVLADVVPPEAAVREALLQHSSASPLERLSAPAFQHHDAPPQDRRGPVSICRRWERAARRAAQSLARRRALAAAWREPEPTPDSPVRSDHPRVGCLVPRPHGTLAVFSVPIVDAADILIERRLVAIAADAAARTACDCRALAAALAPGATMAIARRVALTARRVRAAAIFAGCRERALAAALREELLADEGQPGLFDLREARAIDARLNDAERAQAASERQLGRGDRSGDVHAGEPVLEIVLSRRR